MGGENLSVTKPPVTLVRKTVSPVGLKASPVVTDNRTDWLNQAVGIAFYVMCPVFYWQV